MTIFLEKLTGLVVFPFIGIAVILILRKLSWKATQPSITGDVQHISSKDTIGWMCISHFITAMLLFFILLWSRVIGIGQIIMLPFIVALVVNVIITLKFKYAMVGLSNDMLLIRGFFHKAVVNVSEIDSISQDFIRVTTPRIRIYFKHKTPFGKSIIFIPVNEQIEHDLKLLLQDIKTESVL